MADCKKRSAGVTSLRIEWVKWIKSLLIALKTGNETDKCAGYFVEHAPLNQTLSPHGKSGND